MDYDYEEVIENGEWLEDQGSRFSRFLLNDESLWLDHDLYEVISDPSEAE